MLVYNTLFLSSLDDLTVTRPLHSKWHEVSTGGSDFREAFPHQHDLFRYGEEPKPASPMSTSLRGFEVNIIRDMNSPVLVDAVPERYKFLLSHGVVPLALPAPTKISDSSDSVVSHSKTALSGLGVG